MSLKCAIANVNFVSGGRSSGRLSSLLSSLLSAVVWCFIRV